MAFPKKEIFPTRDQLLSNYASALCHPARVFILRQLQRQGGLCVVEIERVVPLSQPAVSDHLRILRRTGLIRVRIEGRNNYYTLNADVLNQANDILCQLFDQVVTADCPGVV
jgi:DNA-binding transcriptional ArsR family regulator